MKKYSRAQRRFERVRIIKKRQYHWGYGHKNNWSRDAKRGEICFMPPAEAGLVARTSTPCSCYMCGNPRRSWMTDSRLTMQERKALDNYNDQVNDDGFDDYWDYYDDSDGDDEFHIYYEWLALQILEKIWFE